jgi:hypothetical protein
MVYLTSLSLGRGRVSLAELLRLLESIDAADASSYRKIIDISRLARGVPKEVMKEVASLVRQREITRSVGPIAIVAGSASTHRQATWFANQAQGERLIRIFPDQHEAYKWLDSFHAFEGEPRLAS